MYHAHVIGKAHVIRPDDLQTKPWGPYGSQLVHTGKWVYRVESLAEIEALYAEWFRDPTQPRPDYLDLLPWVDTVGLLHQMPRFRSAARAWAQEHLHALPLEEREERNALRILGQAYREAEGTPDPAFGFWHALFMTDGEICDRLMWLGAQLLTPQMVVPGLVAAQFKDYSRTVRLDGYGRLQLPLVLRHEPSGLEYVVGYCVREAWDDPEAAWNASYGLEEEEPDSPGTESLP